MNKAKYIALSSILFLTPLLFSQNMIWGYFTPKHLFFQLIIALLPILTILLKETRIKLNIIDVSVYLWLLTPVLHAVLMGQLNSNINLLDTNFYLLIFYFFLRTENSLECLYPILKWFVIASFFMALYSILQFFNFDPFIPDGTSLFGYRVIGTLGNANSLGSFLATSIPIAIYYCYQSKVRSLLYIYCTTVIFIGLFLSVSRGAILGLLISFVLFYSAGIREILKKYVKRIWFKIIVIISVIMITVAALTVIYNINPESAKGRLFIWQVTCDMIKDHIITGIGYGRYGVEYLNYQATFYQNPYNKYYFDRAANMKQSDNEYLQIWAELGIIGLIIFVVAMTCILYQQYFFNRKGGKYSKQAVFLVKAVGISTASVLLHSLVDNPLRNLIIGIIFYLNLAITAYAIDMKRIIFNRNIVISKPIIRIILAILGVLFFVYITSDSVSKYKAYVLWKSGQKMAHQNDWNDAIKKYERAMSLIPYNHELKFHLGAAYSYIQQPEKALPLLEESKKSFNDKNLYTVLGATYLQMGQFKLAEKNFRMAIAMYPKLLLPRLWLAEMYIHQNRLGDAEKELGMIISIEPKNWTDQIIRIKHDAKDLLKKVLIKKES